MRIGIDYDGVITANYAHYAQLVRDLIRSNHEVYVITAANYKRFKEVTNDLIRSGIDCNLVGRPKDFISTPFNIGTWKKIQLLKYDIDLWFDNEVKQYEQAGVDFSDIKTQIVRI